MTLFNFLRSDLHGVEHTHLPKLYAFCDFPHLHVPVNPKLYQDLEQCPTPERPFMLLHTQSPPHAAAVHGSSCRWVLLVLEFMWNETHIDCFSVGSLYSAHGLTVSLFFSLKYSWFTVFQVYSKVIHLYIHTHTHIYTHTHTYLYVYSFSDSFPL